MLGEKRMQTLANMAVGYYRYRLTANRSYAAMCAASTLETGGGIAGFCAVTIVDAADMVVAITFGNIEPHPAGGSTTHFTPATTGNYFVRIANGGTGATHTMTLLVIETTLASPWFFVSPSSGYESYVTIRNQSDGARNVTVRAYNSAGSLASSTTIVVPAAGNTFVRVGADLGVVSASGSVTITHDGMPGSVVANTTTLSATTGLSFDAPFTPRMVWSTF